MEEERKMEGETKKEGKVTKKNGWGGYFMPCLSPTPRRLGEGVVELVSTVTAGSWWPGM